MIIIINDLFEFKVDKRITRRPKELFEKWSVQNYRLLDVILFFFFKSENEF